MKRFQLFVASCLLICVCIANGGTYTITVNGNDSGRAYEGIGAVSAGGNSRLLIDYPETQRSQVLDYLFKPNFGAAFEHLKVEIGSGQNSTSGAVASHAYTDAEIINPVSRSYEFWLMSEARSRNSNIILDCLAWGLPKCTDGVWTKDMADYITSFVKLADTQWGVKIDWVGGCVNERSGGTDNSWLKNTLRPSLDSAGYANVKIQAEESHSSSDGWDLMTDCIADSALDSVVDAVTKHYVEDDNDWPTVAQIAHGKPMWDSEQHVGGGDWNSAVSIVRTMIRDYIEGRITKQELWCPIDSAADGLFLSNVGTMQADEPWSGNFSVRPALWGVAHFTQFADPGWQFLDNGCGYLSGNGCYATLINTVTGDYSIILYAENAEIITVNLAGDVSNSLVNIWKSTSASQFYKTVTRTPSDGSYAFSVTADTLFSITTTTGQRKGVYSSPSAADLEMPYSEDFESYEAGDMPKYLSDNQGTFQIQNAKGGRDGLALQQVVSALGSGWGTAPNRAMTVIPGPMSWDNYELSADVYIEAGEIYLAVRKGSSSWAWTGLFSGYTFVLEKDGDWALHFDNAEDNGAILNRGFIDDFDGDKWHKVSLSCVDDTIDAYVDGLKVCTVIDRQRASGNACIGGSFNANQYDNILVKPAGMNWSIVNQEDSSLTYFKTWYYYTGGWYMFGNCRYAGTANASVKYPFYGRFGRVWGTRRNSSGIMDVYVDDVYQTTVDCYSSDPVYGTVLYETSELPLGNHVIKVVVKGERNSSSSNDTIVLEAFSSSENQFCSAPEANLSIASAASASSYYQNNSSYDADKANDTDYTTRWNSNTTDNCWLEIDFGTTKTFSSTRITEYLDRIQSYKIQYYDGTWKDAYIGTTIGNSKTDVFAPVTGSKARLYIVSASTVPTIFEFEVYHNAGVCDINTDGVVDISDLADLCSRWLNVNCGICCNCSGADFYHDGFIQLSDYRIFAEAYMF